jgi:DNA sulfur modification protein DndC
MMSKPEVEQRYTAFSALGIRETIRRAEAEIRELYLSDSIPWVVGYSGGKDSTASLQLIWNALSSVNAEQRRKPVYVISTDTLVENPIVAMWVQHSLKVMAVASEKQRLPFEPNRLTPASNDTFWVNLVGKGIQRLGQSSGGAQAG